MQNDIKRDDNGKTGSKRTMLRFILQAVVTGLGLWLAAWLVPGVAFLSTGSSKISITPRQPMFRLKTDSSFSVVS